MVVLAASLIRARLDAKGSVVVDGKAIGWTREHVHLKWQDDDYQMHTRWIPAAWVKRISREESSWQDPYDDRD
jgi:outer membrane receptor for ferrienterochelin and colicin